MPGEDKICYQPIGRVENDFQYPSSGSEIKQYPSRLIIEERYREGLEGAAPGQKLLVLFDFHQAEEDQIPLLQHPRGDRTRQPRGVFLLRSPLRPNSIGATEVTVEKVEGTRLTVRGLDAVDGTPILDLKIIEFGPSES